MYLLGATLFVSLLALSLPLAPVHALSCLNPTEMVDDYATDERYAVAHVVAGTLETEGDTHDQTVIVTENLKGTTDSSVSFSYHETWQYLCAGSPAKIGEEAVYVTSEGNVVQVITLDSPLYESLMRALEEAPEKPAVATEDTKRTLMQRVIGLLQQMLTLLRSEANPSTTEPKIEAVPEDLIGMPTEKATTYAAENDFRFRIVEIDGEPQPTTKDYRPGRINAAVENGVVVSYEVEGEDASAEAREHDEIIGMTQTEVVNYATENDITLRIGRIDEQYLPLTLDYRPGRVTAEIDDGAVSAYSVE